MAFTTIQGSGANDATSFVGSSGVDTILIQNVSNPIFAGGQQAADIINYQSFTALVSDYTLKGGQGNDTFGANGGGTNLNNGFINGNAGNDLYTGNAHTSTTVFGGQGDDQLTVNGILTSSRINGNRGADSASITAGAAASSIFGGQGADTLTLDGAFSSSLIQGDNDGDTINLSGTAGTDSYTSTTINGNGGNDSINAANALTGFTTSTAYGGAGNDVLTFTNAAIAVTLSGDAGNDQVLGGAGTDTLLSGDGTDTITGAGGADTMTGGAGADSYLYANFAQMGTVATGASDTIVDFATTTDTIQRLAAVTFVVQADGDIGANTTYADALADATTEFAANVNTNYYLSGYGTGASWTSVLFYGTAAGAVAEGSIYIGTIGNYGTAAAAGDTIVAGDIVA